MPKLGETLGHSNGFDDEYDTRVRMGAYPGLEDGPGGLFPAGETYPSNSDFCAAFDSFHGRSHEWMNDMGHSEGPQKLYE